MDLWLPNQEAETQIEADKEAHRVTSVGAALKQIDGRLDLFLQKANTQDLRAGFYYVKRSNDDGTTSLWEVSDPEGGFLEPGEGLLEAFRKADTHRTGWWAEVESDRARKEANARQARERARDERAWGVKDDLDYLGRIQIPVPRKPGFS